MSNKITTNEIPTPATVFVTGLLTYSRLKEQIAGDKLTADKETRKKKNLPIINEPYTTATIRQPQILFENPNGATDENARTIAEKYAIQRMYKGQSGSGEWQFSMTNKGKFLPKIYVRNKDNPTELIPFTLEGELAKDVRVTLIVKIYKATPNNGVTLAGVIIEEGAKVESSVIMPGSIIRRGAVVRRSIIAENAVVGPGAFVGEDTGNIAVIGTGVSLPAGVHIPAGQQVDEDYTF